MREKRRGKVGYREVRAGAELMMPIGCVGNPHGCAADLGGIQCIYLGWPFDWPAYCFIVTIAYTPPNDAKLLGKSYLRK